MNYLQMFKLPNSQIKNDEKNINNRWSGFFGLTPLR